MVSWSWWVGCRSLYCSTRLRLVVSSVGFFLAASSFLRVTVTLQAARSPWSEMAVMMAVPALRPVTLPSPSTVATLELLLIQTMK